MKQQLRILVLALLLVAGAGRFPAFAFSFSPMVSTITVGEGRSTMRYSLRNDSEQPIAVQITVVRREIAEDGSEANAPTDSLVAYPSQIVLRAGERQEIRVDWLGGSVLREQPYRVIAEQVPVDLGDGMPGRARLRMNLRYVTSLYVAPPGAQSDVEVRSVSAAGGSAEVVFANDGTRHRLLQSLTVEFSAASGHVWVVDPQSGVEALSGVLPAGGVRRVRIELPSDLDEAGGVTELTARVLD